MQFNEHLAGSWSGYFPNALCMTAVTTREFIGGEIQKERKTKKRKNKIKRINRKKYIYNQTAIISDNVTEIAKPYDRAGTAKGPNSTDVSPQNQAFDKAVLSDTNSEIGNWNR